MSLDKRAHSAGLKALLAFPKIRLLAEANAFDRFIIVAAKPVEDAVSSMINIHDDDECKWFSDYINDPPKKTTVIPERWTEPRLAYHNPFNLKVCREAYDRLRS